MNKVTTWFMIAVVLIVIGWDVYLGAAHYDTESMIIAGAGRVWNVIPYLFGALLGHWFLNRKVSWGGVHYEWWPWALLTVGVVAGWDVLTYFFKLPGGWSYLKHPALWVMIGLPAGSFLWPQRLPDEFGE